MDNFAKEERDFIRIGIQEAYLSSEFLLKYLDNGPVRDEHLRNMEELVKNYCLLDQQIQIRPNIINKLKQEETAKNTQQENSEVPGSEVDNQTDITEVLSERISTAMKKVDLSNHEKLKDFQKKVSKLKIQQDGTAGEDDLEVTDESNCLIDPLSKRELVDPVISIKCQHRFSRKNIMQHLSGNSQCPYVGCRQKLSPLDLEDDVIAANTLRRLQLQKQI